MILAMITVPPWRDFSLYIFQYPVTVGEKMETAVTQ